MVISRAEFVEVAMATQEEAMVRKGQCLHPVVILVATAFI